MTPAALAAALNGDLGNALAALTPGGIEAQEARGQRTFVANATLPKECNWCSREEIEAMGVVFHDDADDLFVNVTLPDGWEKRATDHSMWSELVDDKSRVRAKMFYKAAFYDRSAHIDTVRYINIKRLYLNESGDEVGYNAHTHIAAAVTNAEGEELFRARTAKRGDWSASDSVEDEAEAWADEHYPDRKDASAYWN